MLTRLHDDATRRRSTRSDGDSPSREPLTRPGVLAAVWAALLTLVATSLRVLLVATPPAEGTAPTSDTSTADADLARRRTTRGLIGRPLTSVAYVPGAHPVTPAALAATTAVHEPVSPVVFPAPAAGAPAQPSPASADRFLPAIRAFAVSLVAWMQPIFHVLVPPAGNASTAAAVSPASVDPARPRSSTGWLRQQRIVGAAIGVLILVASVVGVGPIHGTAGGGTGNVNGGGSGPRLSIGGTQGGDGVNLADGHAGSLDSLTASSPAAGAADVFGTGTDTGSLPVTGGQAGAQFAAVGGAAVAGGFGVVAAPGLSAASETGPVVPSAVDSDPLAAGTQPDTSGPALQDIEAFSDNPGSFADGERPAATTSTDTGRATDAAGIGAFLADGTILKPIAVDTTAPDARTLLTKYRVRRSDTLTSIAHHFGLSLQTLYWANHLTVNLKTKTDLRFGMVLSIPPVNGALHIVTDTETLTDISRRSGVSVNRIIEANGLKQPTVFVGEWIIIPGAKQKPVPVVAPKPTPKPAAHTTTTSSTSHASTTTTSRPTPKPVSKPVTRPVHPTYSGGGWAWPVPSGHISQYFHYGHWAIDIAATYGDPVLAAKAGTVTFAGWKNNGGGWQVWMYHGNNIYTTYNHMSSLTVHAGETLSAGQQVGRIGMTGDATGPHCHFEVWIGPIWAGGQRVNPLNYV
jgi:murein DD-endopeptidase MepM/ murein hydrolase activator NlpD